MPSFKLVPALKLLFFIVIGLFALKLFFGFIATKWPNKVTNAANTVVQSA